MNNRHKYLIRKKRIDPVELKMLKEDLKLIKEVINKKFNVDIDALIREEMKKERNKNEKIFRSNKDI